LDKLRGQTLAQLSTFIEVKPQATTRSVYFYGVKLFASMVPKIGSFRRSLFCNTAFYYQWIAQQLMGYRVKYRNIKLLRGFGSRSILQICRILCWLAYRQIRQLCRNHCPL